MIYLKVILNLMILQQGMIILIIMNMNQIEKKVVKINSIMKINGMDISLLKKKI